MSFPSVLPPQGKQDFPSPWSYFQTGTSPLNVVYIGAANQTALTTLSFAKNTLVAYPVVIGGGVSVDTLYVEATAVVANAVGRVGIYKNTDDSTIYPSSLIVESGEVALATAVVRSVSVSAQLPPGLYWFATLCGTANPTLRSINAGGMTHLCGLKSDLTRQFYYTVSQTYGAMPTTFTASATFEATNAAPAVGVHFA